MAADGEKVRISNVATLFFYPELDEMSKLDGGMIEFDDHKVFTPISSSIFFRLLQDQIRLSLFKHYSFNTKTIYL